MISEKFIKKMRFAWIFIVLIIIAISTFDLPFVNSGNGSVGVYYLIVLAGFLGWYLLVNFISSNLIPSFVKSYATKDPVSDFGLLLIKLIVTKEAFQIINQYSSMNNKGFNHE